MHPEELRNHQIGLRIQVIIYKQSIPLDQEFQGTYNRVLNDLDEASNRKNRRGEKIPIEQNSIFNDKEILNAVDILTEGYKRVAKGDKNVTYAQVYSALKNGTSVDHTPAQSLDEQDDYYSDENDEEKEFLAKKRSKSAAKSEEDDLASSFRGDSNQEFYSEAGHKLITTKEMRAVSINV